MESMGGGGEGSPLFLDGEWESLCKLFSPQQDQDHHTIDPHFNQKAFSSPNSTSFSQMSCGDVNYISSNDLNHMTQPNYNYSDDQISAFDYHWEEGSFVEDHHPTSSKIFECSSNDRLESMVDEEHAPKKRACVSKHAWKRKKDIEVVANVKKVDGDFSDNDSEEFFNEESKEILNKNGKKRASRGAATDPQSLYARNRRDRINKRLRILQTLVPNGTKVDISTMLEEAVNYVKYMQLQIKLLSSDEMWMFAPLAYNTGFDMGF